MTRDARLAGLTALLAEVASGPPATRTGWRTRRPARVPLAVAMAYRDAVARGMEPTDAGREFDIPESVAATLALGIARLPRRYCEVIR